VLSLLGWCFNKNIYSENSVLSVCNIEVVNSEIYKLLTILIININIKRPSAKIMIYISHTGKKQLCYFLTYEYNNKQYLI